MEWFDNDGIGSLNGNHIKLRIGSFNQLLFCRFCLTLIINSCSYPLNQCIYQILYYFAVNMRVCDVCIFLSNLLSLHTKTYLFYFQHYFGHIRWGHCFLSLLISSILLYWLVHYGMKSSKFQSMNIELLFLLVISHPVCTYALWAFIKIWKCQHVAILQYHWSIVVWNANIKV